MSEVKHEVLLQAKGIYKNFETSKKDQAVHALTNVDLTLYRGETLALVGESGCGKSTLGRTLIRMLPATRGSVTFEGQNITAMKDKEFAPLRRRMQMVFQDPYASLDPRMKVRDIIAEPLETYHVCKTKAETTHRVLELMQAVGVPAEFLNRYPHQFSGGQRQRIGIARAIALQPDNGLRRSLSLLLRQDPEPVEQFGEVQSGVLHRQGFFHPFVGQREEHLPFVVAVDVAADVAFVLDGRDDLRDPRVGQSDVFADRTGRLGLPALQAAEQHGLVDGDVVCLGERLFELVECFVYLLDDTDRFHLPRLGFTAAKIGDSVLFAKNSRKNGCSCCPAASDENVSLLAFAQDSLADQLGDCP